MRSRRFIVAVLAVGLAFGVTILLSGFVTSLDNEIQRTLDAFGADEWLSSSGSFGPFTANAFLPEDTIEPILKASPSAELNPILAITTGIRTSKSDFVGANVIGVGEPIPLSKGRWPTGKNEIVANDELGEDIGGTLTLVGERFRIVGLVHQLRYFAGQNVFLLPLDRAQEVFVYGQPLTSGFAVTGKILPSAIPPELREFSNYETAVSMRRPVNVIISAIRTLSIFLWIVAAAIMGTILFMTALERLRDFAALKAIGASNRNILTSLSAQALVLGLVSGITAALISLLITPLFPVPVEVPFRTYPIAVATAVGIGLLAALAGIRKAVRTDPALAFGG